MDDVCDVMFDGQAVTTVSNAEKRVQLWKMNNFMVIRSLPACLCLPSSVTNSLINHWKHLKRQL